MPEKKITDITQEDLENTIRAVFDEVNKQQADYVQKIVDDSFKKNRTDFYIEPEVHYNDHKDIRDFFTSMHEAGSVAKKVLISGIVLFILSAIGTGIIYIITHQRSL